MKTKVTVIADDNQYKEYSLNDKGYIDGYVTGGDNRPYAAVVIGKKIVMIPMYALKAEGLLTPEN